jgi:flagellar biosynthesis protein FlhF
MRLKRFTAASLPEAMDQVRASLGPEAIILSTQEEPQGQVMVTAAMDGGDTDDGDRLITRKTEALQTIGRLLDFHRVPNELSDALHQAAGRAEDDDPLFVLAEALRQNLTFAPADFAASRGPIMLVGLPGAGKTAVAAKIGLAARIAERPYRLITLDGAKTGGVAQAEGFASSLGAELHEATSPEDLHRLVAAAPPGALVCIDTPGHNPFRAASLAGLTILLEAASAEAVQVIAAGGDSAEAREVAQAFHRVGARRMIATKLDLARRLGGLLSAASDGRANLAAVTDAAEVTGGLSEMAPVALAEVLLRETHDELQDPSRMMTA